MDEDQGGEVRYIVVGLTAVACQGEKNMTATEQGSKNNNNNNNNNSNTEHAGHVTGVTTVSAQYLKKKAG